MKKTLLSIIAVLTLCFYGVAQDSKGFSFQGIARDASGNIISSQDFTLTAYLKEGTTTYYEESHNLKTDQYGVFDAIIGHGNAASGYSFATLDFTKDFTVQIDIHISNNSYTLATYALQSVPYAKHAYNGCPPGSIMAYGGTTAPDGWLICDGREFSSTDFPALYKAIGTAWGTSATGKFNIPDMQGMFLRGVGGADADSRIASKTGGNSKNNVGSKQDYETKAHDHGSAGNHTHTATTSSAGEHNHIPTHDQTIFRVGYSYGNQQLTPTNWDNNDSQKNELNLSQTLAPINAGAHYHTLTTESNGTHTHTSFGGSETRPVNVAVYYIIKY